MDYSKTKRFGVRCGDPLNHVKIGNRYRFDLPEEFNVWPEYNVQRGKMVTVEKLLTTETEYRESSMFGKLYAVRSDEDGKIYHAWEVELTSMEGEMI